jgi:hypothetical protein
MTRFTGPVRFFLKGNRHAAMGLKHEARELINKIGTYSRRERGANGLRRVRYTDGTTITVSKVAGVYNAIIYVPKKVDEKETQSGFVVYPYIGWIYPRADINYFNQAGHQRRRMVGWQPPYNTPNGDPILEDGNNKGTLFPVSYEDYNVGEEFGDPNWPEILPGYPRLILPPEGEWNPEGLPEEAVEEPKYESKYFAKAGDNTKYEPSKNILYDNPYDAEPEMFFRNHSYWVSPEDWPHKYHVAWKGLGSGDIYLPEDLAKAVYDLGNYVFVNGIQYNVPWTVRSAAIQRDVDTDTYWLSVVTIRESFTTFNNQDLYVFTIRIQPDVGVVGGGTSSIAAFESAGTEAERDYWANAWFHLNDDPTAFIHIPQIGTMESTWVEYGLGLGHQYFYDSFGYKWNASGNQFAFFCIIEGVSATELNVQNFSLTVQTREVEGKTYYLPSTSTSLASSEYAKLLNPAFEGDWKNYPSETWNTIGTIPLGIGYVGDTLELVEAKIEHYADVVLNASNGNWAGFRSTISRMTVTIEGTDYVTETTRTYNFQITNDVYIFTPATYTCTLDVIVFYDFISKDRERERGTSELTSISPEIWSLTYEKNVYYEGTEISQSSGSYTYNKDTPAAWCQYGYTTACVPPKLWGSLYSGFVTQTNHPGVERNTNDNFADNDTRFLASLYFKGISDGAIQVHRGDPNGYVVGTYVKRSINGGPDDIYSYPIEGGSEPVEDWNWRTTQYAFITKDQKIENVLGNKGYTDKYGKQMHPIVGTMYYKKVDHTVKTIT